MADREKVLKGLEACADRTGALCRTCPYDYRKESCISDMADDALELLKEQPKQKFFVDSNGKITPLPIQKHGHWISVPDKSPKTITINMYSFICSCSECGQSVGHHIEYNYCPRCGAKMDEGVKQDG